jgi:phosphatidate cytidylyltransferase
MILVTKCGDIGAYSIGTLSAKLLPGGNHKIIPKISPKKSWEGTLGGLLTSVAASFAFCRFVPQMVVDGFGQISFPLLTGALLFVGGFLGDLVESSLKRAAGVKDSGNMIPGMGGALDVVDSLVLNAPLFYLFLNG